VPLSTPCGLGCFRHRTKYIYFQLKPIFSGFTTVQAVDSISLYRDFPSFCFNLVNQLRSDLRQYCGLWVQYNTTRDLKNDKNIGRSLQPVPFADILIFQLVPFTRAGPEKIIKNLKNLYFSQKGLLCLLWIEFSKKLKKLLRVEISQL
jgi:hypothetical protein